MIIDIKQAEQLRQDILTIAQLHHRSAALFDPSREDGIRALLRGSSDDLVYIDVARTAFSETLWRLFEYGSSSTQPAPAMELTDWVGSHGTSRYLMMLVSAGRDGKLSVEETCAAERCFSVCQTANDRFAAANGWSFIK